MVELKTSLAHLYNFIFSSCHPMQAADVGGVSLMVEALQKCTNLEADSSSGERTTCSSSYEHNMYFLKVHVTI